MITLLKQIKKVKTFSGVLNIFKNNKIHCIQIIKPGNLYNITLGDNNKNIFVTIELSMIYPTVRAVYRKFNGKNYDLYQEIYSIRLKTHGYFNLRNYLNDHV